MASTEFHSLPPGPAPQRDCAPNCRVLVVSDVRLYQEAIATVLSGERSVTVVGTTTPPQALTIAAELRPDIVLLDMTRPANLDCARGFAVLASAMKVVTFGVAETDDEIVSLAAAGVAGYLSQDAALQDVVAVIESAMRDELLCSPRAAATLCSHVALLSRSGAITPPGATATLSRRELQIAALIDRGLSNKEIARQLGIQTATVKNHVHSILDKLKVHRRGEAAACLRPALRVRSQAGRTIAR